jgi:hypothetical protein
MRLAVEPRPNLLFAMTIVLGVLGEPKVASCTNRQEWPHNCLCARHDFRGNVAKNYARTKFPF